MRQTIGRPIWSERGRDRISFVWSAMLQHQFTPIAIFVEHASDDHKMAA